MPFIYSCSTLSDNGIPTTSSSSFFCARVCAVIWKQHYYYYYCYYCEYYQQVSSSLNLPVRQRGRRDGVACGGGGHEFRLEGKEKEPWPAKWVSVINAISAQECPIPQWFSFSWSAAHLPPRKLLRLSFVFALAFLAMTTTGTTMMIAINEINAYLKEPDRRINWRKWDHFGR